MATRSTSKKSASKSKQAAASGHTTAKTQTSHSSHTTTDHDQIRRWAEERGAHPACVKGTGDKNDIGILRLDFPGYSEDKLEEISWDDFFEKFEERNLALLYQEQTAGGERSNFNKLISRSGQEESGSEESETEHKTRGAR
jgi:hypothetical protein